MRYTKPGKRGIRFFAAGFCAFVLWAGGAQAVRAAEIIYENRTTTKISKNVTYETSQMVTSAGLLDVHILRVPLNDPYIQLEAVSSQREFGLKETTAALVNAAGGIAGINGDFFDSNGRYGMPVGLTISDGIQKSASNEMNMDRNAYATFFLEESGRAFIDYVHVEVAVYIDGKASLPVHLYNKLVNFDNPVYIDHTVMTDTSILDARDSDLYKLVVENGVVTYRSSGGETVAVPQNGFIIVMNRDARNKYAIHEMVGKAAQAVFNPSVDISKVTTAISGAGRILANGQIATEGYVPTGRHPRSAIGITRDGTTAILMVADGRTHSIGATHQEMAALMLREGAYHAMHLDGGGSSSLVMQAPGQTAASMVNRPSDGAQRTVPNALAVISTAPVGEIKTLVLAPSRESAAKGSTVQLEVYGLDEYAHRIAVPKESVQFTVSEGAAIANGALVINRSGRVVVSAAYNGLTAAATVYGVEAAAIKYSGAAINLAVGKQQTLSFTGTGLEGYSIDVAAAGLQYEVVPSGLGVVENGVFRAVSTGRGWIRCALGDAVTHVPVYVGVTAVAIESLTGGASATYSAFPATVSGTATYRLEETPSGTGAALRLTYTLAPSTATQAAYINFGSAITARADGFRVSVHGDGSGHWLRGRVLDAEGTEYLITFTQNANFTGWRELEAMLPADAVQPVTLDRLYAASLSEAVQAMYSLSFSNLRALRRMDFGGEALVLPADGVVWDALRSALQADGRNADITFMGKLWHTGGDHVLADYAVHLNTAVDAFTRGAAHSIYAGTAALQSDTAAIVHPRAGGYSKTQIGGITLLRIDSTGGGFSVADPYQWGRVKNDLQTAETNVIVIETDISPLQFRHSQEGELFQNLLREYADTHSIFVVSSAGIDTSVTVREGVRYINLGHMYNGSEFNPNFSVLRLRIQDGAVQYGLDPVRN